MTLADNLPAAAHCLAAQLRVRLVTNSITLMTLLAQRADSAALMIKVGVLEELRRGDLVFTPLTRDRLPPQRLSLITGRGAATRALTDALTDDFIAVLGNASNA